MASNYPAIPRQSLHVPRQEEKERPLTLPIPSCSPTPTHTVAQPRRALPTTGTWTKGEGDSSASTLEEDDLGGGRSGRSSQEFIPLSLQNAVLQLGQGCPPSVTTSAANALIGGPYFPAGAGMGLAWWLPPTGLLPPRPLDTVLAPSTAAWAPSAEVPGTRVPSRLVVEDPMPVLPPSLDPAWATFNREELASIQLLSAGIQRKTEGMLPCSTPSLTQGWPLGSRSDCTLTDPLSSSPFSCAAEVAGWETGMPSALDAKVVKLEASAMDLGCSATGAIPAPSAASPPPIDNSYAYFQRHPELRAREETHPLGREGEGLFSRRMPSLARMSVRALLLHALPFDEGMGGKATAADATNVHGSGEEDSASHPSASSTTTTTMSGGTCCSSSSHCSSVTENPLPIPRKWAAHAVEMLESRVTCRYCHKRISTTSFSRHIELHTRNDPKPWKCTLCPSQPGHSRKDHLKRHLQKLHKLVGPELAAFLRTCQASGKPYGWTRRSTSALAHRMQEMTLQPEEQFISAMEKYEPESIQEEDSGTECAAAFLGGSEEDEFSTYCGNEMY